MYCASWQICNLMLSCILQILREMSVMFKLSNILNGILMVIFSFHVIKTLRGITNMGRGEGVNRGSMEGPEAIYKFGFNH